jgi:hypothetical protein
LHYTATERLKQLAGNILDTEARTHPFDPERQVTRDQFIKAYDMFRLSGLLSEDYTELHRYFSKAEYHS